MWFFKQKTADEWRISDWSADVCSSDLSGPLPGCCSLFSRGCCRSLDRGTRCRHSPKPHSRLASPRRSYPPGRDRKSVVEGKRGSVRVGVGGRRILKTHNGRDL